MTPLVADLSFVDAMLWVVAIMILGVLAFAVLVWFFENWQLFAFVAVIAVIAFPIWLIAKLF